MQHLKHKKDFDSTKRPKCPKLLFVGVKPSMQVIKKANAFLIYGFLSLDVEPCPHEIPSQYQKFKDVYEKKNVDTLPKH
jgi:hypothetical protein